MYTLIQDDKDPTGFHDITYTTPCGGKVMVAMINFGSSPEETAVAFPSGQTTQKVMQKILEVIDAHQS